MSYFLMRNGIIKFILGIQERSVQLNKHESASKQQLIFLLRFFKISFNGYQSYLHAKSHKTKCWIKKIKLKHCKILLSKYRGSIAQLVRVHP